MEFYINFDYLKYCFTLLFILITEFFTFPTTLKFCAQGNYLALQLTGTKL